MNDTVTNSYPLLREAKVINTSDPEKLGRVQLKVYPELSGIPDDDCPWCFPNDGGVHGKSIKIPLVGSLINCIVWNRYWNEITFLPFTIAKPKEHLFTKWKNNQKPKISDMSKEPEEEHFIVEQFEDDFNFFHDTKNRQHGLLHPSGSYFLLDKDGNIFCNSSGSINVTATKDCIVKGVNVNIEATSSAEVKSSQVTITGGVLIVDGIAAPTGEGAFCGLTNCLFTGASHVGNKITGT